jgi:undecaprenyl diphosphate synthase
LPWLAFLPMSELKHSLSQANGSMPSHVAIIMDGNGRWAQQRGLPREQGHRKGVDNVKRIVEAARELDLRYLTLYAFSVENWKRPRTEVNALMRLLEGFLRDQAQDLIDKEIGFRVVGNLDGLPKKVTQLLKDLIEATRGFDRWNLSIALNYGSRQEILTAVKSYAAAVAEGREDPAQLDWTVLSRYLYTDELPDPDLVIRTSGEHRVSNFLLLQSAYAEYVFVKEFWPDFGPEAFQNAIADFQSRQRRFGKTGDQVLKATS